MIILSAQNIAKAFGVNTVLRDVSLTVQQGDRIGLVGVNGCGKSTLMRILAGLDPQDSGEISLVRGTRVGYLAQQNMVTSGETVWNELQKVYEPVFVMEKKLRELEDEMAHAHTDEQRFARLSSDYDRLIQRFEEADGYAWKSMVSGVLNGLGFKPTQYDQCVDSLSGGEQTRLCLAHLLLQKPDLLLLDEPTNHLDMETLQWLENYLSAYKGSVLVISHDRYFLDHVCTGIVEILMGSSEQYNGNYTRYIAQRQERFESRMRAYEIQQKEIERQQAIIARYRMFNREKSIRAAESREKALDRMEKLEKPVDERAIRFSFEARRRTGEDVLQLSELSKSFGEKHLFHDLTLHVRAGDRVFRVRNAEAAFVDDDKLPSVAVCARAELRIGQPALLTFTVAAGDASVTVEGPEVEAARTKAITEEEVREHIDRMGTTPFYLSSLEIDLDEGVGMGFSMLHKLRARAAEELQETILAHYHARKLERTPSRVFAPVVRKGWCKVAALATNPACARAAKRAGADLIYVPAANYRRGEAVIAGQLSDTAEQAGYPKQCIPVLPTVSQMFDEEKRNGFDTWKRVKADKPVMVENLGQLLHATEMGAAPEVGPHIPVTNKLDLQAMADLGAQRVWLSPELSLVQIEELGDMAPMPLGLTIMGQTELMVTEHCLLMSQGPCNQKCAECARRKSPHYLKDRKGYEMPVITDCTGRSHLYNAVQMDVAHLMPEIIGAGVSTVLVDTTLMNVKETTEKVARAVRARDIAQKDGNKVAKAEGATSGHLFRGVS